MGNAHPTFLRGIFMNLKKLLAEFLLVCFAFCFSSFAFAAKDKDLIFYMSFDKMVAGKV